MVAPPNGETNTDQEEEDWPVLPTGGWDNDEEFVVDEFDEALDQVVELVDEDVINMWVGLFNNDDDDDDEVDEEEVEDATIPDEEVL